MAAKTPSRAAILRQSSPHSFNRRPLRDSSVKCAQCVLFLPPFIPVIRRAASVAIVAGLLQGFLTSSAASADRTLTLQYSAAPGAEDTSTILSPQALQEIARVEAEIDRTEAQAIERLAAPPGSQIQQIELLGKLMLNDKQLSVNRNEACA